MQHDPYDRLYLAGIEHFNACEFYEAHEAWEELWIDTTQESRAFYQGLIQTAVCLHHFGNGNVHGARKLYQSCRRYLEPFRPRYLGLDVDKLLGELERCCAQINASGEEDVQGEIDPELIPEIHLDPPPGDTSP